MESNEDLFSKTINRIPIWDSIRHKVGGRLRNEYGFSKEAHDSNWQSRSYLNTGVSIVNSLTSHNPLFSSNKDLLVVGTSRRKLVDGEWTDIHLDYFLEDLDQEYIYLDRPYQLTHFRPARTENITYTDVIEYPAGVLRTLGKQYYSVKSSYSDISTEINSKISLYFDHDITINDLIYDEIILEKVLKRMYKYILNKVDPDAVLLTVGYDTRRLLIRACNELSIPVIEYQHGIITSHHLGYSYPKKVQNITFPDYLFTWGEFWSENFEPPISKDRILPVGYPHYEYSTAKFNRNIKGSGILFISQGTIGEELSKFAVKYAEKNTDKKVIYKLHPGEYNRWRSEYPWLVDCSMSVIEDDSKQLYEFFEQCAVQVGVNSTALFEGLGFNLNTYIYKTDGWELMDRIIEIGYANLVDEPDSIVTCEDSANVSTTDFFTQNPHENFERYLNKIIS
jgi:hypothetical protein